MARTGGGGTASPAMISCTLGAGQRAAAISSSPAGIGMQFSVSYTTTLIAIAVSQKFEIGVDIEAVPATLAEVPWQVLTPAERHYLRTLPEAYREPLTLRLVERMSGPQIAEATGLTHGSVRVNLSRGMELLRERLRARGWP